MYVVAPLPSTMSESRESQFARGSHDQLCLHGGRLEGDGRDGGVYQLLPQWSYDWTHSINISVVSLFSSQLE